MADGDYRSIEACSLVSRSWRPIAQQRMINKVTLPNLNSAASEFLALVSANPRFGTYVQELHLSGAGARVPFKTVYAILAAAPRLHTLSLYDLSFIHWPLNRILLNPIERLTLGFIGLGDGTCSARCLLECFRGLFHDVQELTMLPCDAEFLDCYYATVPHLCLRKLTLPDTDANLLAFLSRFVASCASIDMTISPVADTRQFMETVGSTIDDMRLRCYSMEKVPFPRKTAHHRSRRNTTYHTLGIPKFPSLILAGCTSLRSVRLDVLGPVQDVWPTRASVLKQLPSTVRALSLGLHLDTPDASARRVALARPLFARLEGLERLTFTARAGPRAPTLLGAYIWDDAYSADRVGEQLRLALPELDARGMLHVLIVHAEE